MSDIVENLEIWGQLAAEQASHDWDERDEIRDLFKHARNCAYDTRDEIVRLRAERDRLRDALRPFADEGLWSGPQHDFVCVPVSACDRARAALKGDTP